jgi:hypothetical protein
MSKAIQQRRSGWSLVLVFLAMAAAAALLAPAPSEAGLTKCGLEFIYYDSTFTNVVGYRAYSPDDCGCHLMQWGNTTGYHEIYDSTCF